MEPKKISFGFKKTKKADKPIESEKKDYIECVEENSIKVLGGEEYTENAPLVIPMKPNTLVTVERLKQIAEEVEKGIAEQSETAENESVAVTEVKPQNETLDQMAVRELLEDAKQKQPVEINQVSAIPIPNQPVLEGHKESTLDDYESVPIQEFGLAMLRGMGWQPNKDQSKYKLPELRPKGLGLGADKVIKENQKKNAPKNTSNEEELSIIKNAYVKITSGKHAGCYGKVVSLDEDNGRVMVDITVKKETVSLSEFMMQPVNKSEFDKQSRVINTDSYEEYKKKEGPKLSSNRSSPQIEKKSSNHKIESSRDSKIDEKDHRSNRTDRDNNGKHKDTQKRRESSDERSRRKIEKRYSSSESLSSSDNDKKKKHKTSRRYKGDSDSSDSYKKRKKNKKSEKKDIDKKRKGKKKKRDRDRSPNYKKHRK